MSIKRSNRPFRGAYNRCYIGKNGEYKRMYTNEQSFGMHSGLNFEHKALIIIMSILVVSLIPKYWNNIIVERADVETIVMLLVITLIPLLFGFCFVIHDIKRYNEAYNYFKEHQDKLDTNKMVVSDICIRCGTQNNNDSAGCTNCGQSLKLYESIDTD